MSSEKVGFVSCFFACAYLVRIENRIALQSVLQPSFKSREAIRTTFLKF